MITVPHGQAIGLAFADSVLGPYHRNNSGLAPAVDIPGEDPWGWVDDVTGTMHVFVHDGNGATSAGRCWLHVLDAVSVESRRLL